MKKTLKIGVLSLMIVLSIIPYDLDWEKFLFTGYSATYSVTIIRHHFLVPLSFVILIIVLSFYKRRQPKTGKILLFSLAFFWFLSMRTIAVIESENVVVQGWSLIAISQCEYADKDSTRCSEMLDPILRWKLEKTLEVK